VNIVLVFLAVVAVIGGWWLSKQRLASMPWLETGASGQFPGTEAPQLPAAKLGLGLFLAVAGCLFALLTSAYVMRAEEDAQHLVEGVRLLPPALLWVNTAVLAASSVALHWASAAARRGQRDLMLGNLLAAGVGALAFVAGQVLAWRLLIEAGQSLSSSPANSFFYLLTGIHGLHVLGGLAALGKTSVRALRGAALPRLLLGVQLCAIYWHFLLLVWVIVFALLMGGADAFADICRALVT
jgi:cytochrome c oxidase subunit III